MKKIVALLYPLLCAALVGGCNHRSPVGNSAIELPANAVGDAPGAGLGLNAAAAERARQAVLPPPTDGMRWSWDEHGRSARFGPSPTATTFSIGCDRDRDQLLFRRFGAAPENGQGTMSFTGNGRVASLPAAALGEQSQLSSYWQAASPPSDLTAAVGRVFDGPGVVQIAVAGSVKLITVASPIPRRAFAACHR